MKLALEDIAKALGVSKATVSVVLNGHAAKTGISPVTAAKITDYCARKRYVININAQRATRKLIRNVGVIVFEGGDTEKPNPMADYYESMVVGGATMAAKKNGFSTSLIINHEEKELDSVLQRFYAKEVDGFILSGFPVAPSWRENFRREKIPVVVVGGDPAQGLPTVNINNKDIAVPRKIAIAGADDIPISKYVSPAISTYSLLPHEQGSKAFLMLRKIAEGKDCQPTACLKSELKLRQSA